jgi:threonine dehydratase
MDLETKEPDYIKKILTSNIYDVVICTPLEKQKLLSETFTNKIYFKREDKQVSNSFKIRGACCKIKKICKINKNIICASTGNHALSVSLVSNKYACNLIAVLPRTTIMSVINELKKLGTTVELHGDNYQESLEYAKEYANEHKYHFIDSFDDIDIIAGNGSIAMEIVNQLGSEMDNLDTIFIPVGGGGLISGIAVYIKELYPKVKIIGVGLVDSCSMYESLKQDKIVILDKVNTFVNSTSVKTVGIETFRLCKKYVDKIILVSVDEICAAIKYIYEDNKTIVEPACALSVAGLMKHIDTEKLVGQTFVAIMSGNNLNFDKLKFIAERANIGNKSEAVVKITIPEKPSSLLTLLRSIDNDCTNDSINITQFHYRFDNKDDAAILLGISMGDEISTTSIIEAIGQEYKIEEFSNTIINLHIPFLFGGVSKKLENEYIFTFTIPERTGALMELLEAINHLINITMFHYRNIGDIYGNILMGLQLLDCEYDVFTKLLDKLKFIGYVDETTNKSLNFFIN